MAYIAINQVQINMLWLQYPFRISLHLLSLQMRGKLIRIRWNDQMIRISLNSPRNCKLHDYFDIEDLFLNRLFSMHLSLSLFESTVTRFGPFVGCCDCSYKGTKGLTTRFWNYFRRKTPTGVKDNNKKIIAKDGQWYLFVEPKKRDFWRCGFEVTKTCVLGNVLNEAYPPLPETHIALEHYAR